MTTSDDNCRRCKAKLTKCPTCKGEGMYFEKGFLGPSKKRCPNCNGTGKLCPKHGNNWG